MRIHLLVFVSICLVGASYGIDFSKFDILTHVKNKIGEVFNRWKGENVCSYKERLLVTKLGFQRKKSCKTTRELCELSIEKSCRKTRCEIIYKRQLKQYLERPKWVKTCCPGWEKFSAGDRDCLKNVSCLAISQFTPEHCAVEREETLRKNRQIYQFTTPATVIPDYPITSANIYEFLTYPLLNQSITGVVGLTLANPVETDWGKTYIAMSRRNNLLAVQSQPTFHQYSDYAELLSFFRGAQQTDNATKQFFRFPVEENELKDVIHSETWLEDEVFVDQRLAGLNTMSLRKLEVQEYDKIRAKFNAKIDEAISETAGEQTTMIEMVERGLVFILDYPILENVTHVADFTDRNTSDRREMRSSRSPVTIFLSVENWVKRKNELKVVAIQNSFDASSPLLTPNDGAKWMLAKLEVQRADFVHLELVEHLLKHHFLMEAIIVAMRRTMSLDHPLHEILKYHFRGTVLTNRLALPALLEPGSNTHLLFAIGHVGSIEVLNKAYKDFYWQETDFPHFLEQRGVDSQETLPYFPFRDDALLVWAVVKEFAQNYVNLYYKNDAFVAEDMELQNFANEVSAHGTGPHGGVGNVKGFPAQILTKMELADVLSRIIFTPIRHHATNYPVSYYGGFVPNMPSKIYDDPRSPAEEYNFYRLPQSHVASIQVALSMILGALRVDRLFDYGPKLRDPAARHLVEKTHDEQLPIVDQIIRERNKQRLAENHLSYPYYLPEWMPNSIQA